ncbi:hypothetical protein HZS_7654 [Henneguya salminicola]|nr:hypothetical protein HZS_7654 [Henneguya salminicola]
MVDMCPFPLYTRKSNSWTQRRTTPHPIIAPSKEIFICKTKCLLEDFNDSFKAFSHISPYIWQLIRTKIHLRHQAKISDMSR